MALLTALTACSKASTETAQAAVDTTTTNTASATETAAENAPEYTEKLFSKDVIKIEITASEEDWTYLMENATSKPYISADVTIDGALFGNVGVKTKGNTSLTQVASTDSDRYSLKLNFDKYVDGQTCYGLDKLVLNNIYGDTTYMKEYMSYKLFDYMGVPSSQCTYADIWVNGEQYGFYIAIEDTDDSMLDRVYGEDNDGEAYKPESMDMGGDSKDFSDFGEMSGSFDLANLIEITDSEGSAVSWADICGDFDISLVGTVTLKNGETSDFDMRTMMSLDFSEIASLTDSNGNTVDLSGYTVSMKNFGGRQDRDMPTMPNGDINGGNMPALPNAGNANENDGGGVPAIPNGNTDGGGMPTAPSGNANGENTPAFPSGNADGETANDSTAPTKPDGQTNDNAQPTMPDNNKGGGMNGGTGGVSLVYSDDEASSYSNIFDNALTNVTEEDQQRLIASLKAISEGVDIEKYIDVDEVLRYTAVNVFLVNLDSYFSSMGHNYVLYEEGGVLSMLPWDYNLSFGTFAQGGTDSVINYAIDSVFSGVDMSERPIIGKLLENEEYLAKYHEYLAELVSYVTSGAYSEKITATAAIIDEYVRNDATAFDSYDDYLTGVETLVQFGTLRAESVAGQLDGTIPSTTDAQRNSNALIDDSGFDNSLLGGMDMGGKGGFDGGNFTDDKGGFDGKNMNFGEMTPPSAGSADSGAADAAAG